MTVRLSRPVAESTSDALALHLYDVDDALVDPDAVESARYRVDDKTTGTELRAWSDLIVDANPLTLPLSPEDTRMVDRRRQIEEHVVTVELTYTGAVGADQRFAEQFVVPIENHIFRP